MNQLKKSTQQAITREQVMKISSLAKLELSNSEQEKIQKQLNETLDYIKVLNEIEAGKILPTSQVTGLTNVFRQDNEKPSLSQKEALSGSKSNQNQYFKVKAVFER